MAIFIKIQKELNKLADKQQAIILARFFKTGPGQYGAGDKFLGIKVPQQRLVAKKYYREATLSDVARLLHSPYHEHRLTGLIILVLKFSQSNPLEQQRIYNFYLKNTKYINNWDLVDVTTPQIVGVCLLQMDCQSEPCLPAGRRQRRISRQILYKLVRSPSLWERRIAILATFTFIRAWQFDDTIKLAEILLNDPHDLIHKAVGWMLREVGKRDQTTLIKFLNKNAGRMPRTMLRYAIEKFSEDKRRYYLNKV
ncbi:MAG: DNA alkylation repair protein [Candidatus Magasanikbacteria bacterium]|jgi:3-methyladenine DNA glycosylase AlkD